MPLTQQPATNYRQSLQQLYHSSRQPILPNHRQSQSSSPSSASNSSTFSSSVGLGITLPSTTSDNHPDQPFSGPSSEFSPRRFRDSRLGPMSSVPAGSYFAAYLSSTSRDRSNSANSHSSLGGHRPMTTSTSNLHSSGAVSPSLHTASNHLQSTDSVSQTPSSSSSQAGRSQRPSSRRALTAALELAEAAVQLDATNEDPQWCSRCLYPKRPTFGRSHRACDARRGCVRFRSCRRHGRRRTP